MSNLPASRLVTDIYAHTSSFFFYCAAKFLHFKAHVLLVKYVKYVSLCRAVECLITDTVIAQ